MSQSNMGMNPDNRIDRPMSMGASDTDEAVRQLNSFLRGEISAAETYRMAIDKAGDSEKNAANLGLLREMQEEHGRAHRNPQTDGDEPHTGPLGNGEA